jgi:hypothetical protein
VYDINKLDGNDNGLVKGAPFKSKSECAKCLNTTRNTVSKYLDSEKVFKNSLVFSSTKLPLEKLLSFQIPSAVCEIVTGELLGDGHISYDPNKPNINGRLEFTFSSKILHYVNYLKFIALSHICTTSPPTPWASKGATEPTQY